MSSNQRTRSLATLTTLFALGASGLGAQTVVESFNYATGVLGTRAETGAGLSGNWGSSITTGTIGGSAIGSVINTWSPSAPTGYTIANPSTAYQAGGSANGNSLVKFETPINLSVSGQTVYMSFFIRLGTVTNTGSSFAGVYLGTDTGDFNQFGFTKGSTNTTFGVQTSSGLTVSGAPALAANTDYFVVLRLQTNVSGTQDRLSAAIFTSAGDVGTEPGSYSIVALSGTNSNSVLTNLAFRNGSAQTDFRVDNVLLGDSWASVTAIPEPSSFAALAGLGMLGFAATRRRRSA